MFSATILGTAITCPKQRLLMRIAYTTTFDAQNVRNWSGTPYHMSRAFIKEGAKVTYVGNLKRKLPASFKIKKYFKRYIAQQRESPRFNIYAAKQYSLQLENRLNTTQFDIIVSPLINPIAYLNSDKPIVLWTDALYAGLLGFYAPFSEHSKSSIRQGNEMTRACLSRCSQLIFSSEWAANTAIELYGADKDKVHVIPFGANLENYPSAEEINTLISKRQPSPIRLLFLAKSWERKGGDKVIRVAKALHDAAYPVELHIVGYHPPNLHPIPSYIHCHGFISKHSTEGQRKIRDLFEQSHFLFVPSIAEAFGIVFCEANAYGLPCLTTHVGGIGTIIKDHTNGLKYAVECPVSKICQDIIEIIDTPSRYEDFAKSSYNEFVQRLNWQVSVRKVQALMRDVLS